MLAHELFLCAVTELVKKGTLSIVTDNVYFSISHYFKRFLYLFSLTYQLQLNAIANEVGEHL